MSNSRRRTSEDRRFNFTKADIEKLPLPEGKRWDWYWDTKCSGLALRVSDKGSRVFYLYRWVGGKPQQKSLGPFPALTIEQARRRAAELNGSIAQGHEDLQDAAGSTRGEKTFEELFDWYREHHSSRKKSCADDEMQNRLHFQGLAKTKLSRITKADLRQLHKEIGERSGHYAANKALRLLRAIMNAAITADLFKGPNPVTGIDWFKERSRDRRLMPNEVPAFLKAVEEEPNDSVRDFVLLSLLTGARKSNVLEMRWDQIDLAGRTWYIPETKNGTSQVIPLEAAELDVLKGRKATATSPWVFPGEGGTGHMQDPRKGWLRILKRAGIEGLRLHDLRRTLGSWMVDTGASLPMIGKVLNHKSQQTTAIYARLSVDPVREAKGRAIEAILARGKGQAGDSTPNDAELQSQSDQDELAEGAIT